MRQHNNMPHQNMSGNPRSQKILRDEIYSFSTATFTPGGAVFATGPTLSQVKSGLIFDGDRSWTDDTTNLSTTGTNGGIILWKVPSTGTYTLDLYGAQGGTDGNYLVPGALGARIKGDFLLTKGQILALVVGQKGQDDRPNFNNAWGGGGGGGSFVWVNGTTSAPLIAAGGGGSGGQNPTGDILSKAGGQIGTSGAQFASGGAGGTGGVAGAGGGCGGGGGQGWFGGTSGHCGGGFTWAATYTDPTGLTAYASSARGGFGGGGGSYGGGGGGGGYSGGGGAAWSYSYYGGGGGSYNVGTNQTLVGATNSDNGKIIITKVI